ncbi:glycine betaine/L-proline ABC transporter substrate-binding protein ProX [Marinobacterium sp. D7]|uniref:glycine betaine/L-proline ABC transporter substrate-binding protein ProX n=1 Tax=Marinobacterium ramblicola TaxID=2849041 RepID=UPI001C2D7E78|nr:glycine betaine/L-proline ABC transporter substrate-binding protein ProX [Marinobacterium ramblicola]MBV1790620.1 glycine betaine/L-proline ABC transporter substrate-binding protein ProX [Marinobacterium ramblicola]
MRMQLHLLCKHVYKLTAIAALSSAAMSGVVQAEAMPGNGATIKPLFSDVAEERFRGEVAIAGLKELGYEVAEPKEAEYSKMMAMLSTGEADFNVHLWDRLHDNFFQQAGGESTLLKAGSVIPGVLQGYLIDKKTADQYGINSLEDLQKPDIAKLFDYDGDGKADLTGCNPGWGCDAVINHHLKAYGLEGSVTHHRGPYFELMADTIARYQEGHPVLYYTWVPQWIAGVLIEGKDVVWLEVPFTSLPDGNNDVLTSYKGKNLGFAVDEVMSVVNLNFAKKNSAAMVFLSQLQISAGDESAENLKMKNGEDSIDDIRRHAKEWIAAHRDQFDGWLNRARASAK